MENYNIVIQRNEDTVVSAYTPESVRSGSYQTEAALEKEFIEMLQKQGYDYLNIRNDDDLIRNLRSQLELLNKYEFTDAEWKEIFNDYITGRNEGIEEKSERIQKNYIYALKREDGSLKNIYLVDKENIHNNKLQVINQYTQEEGSRNRYDVTILVNGFPLVHIELKRRGVYLKEAFNQINRYKRDSFWAASGLYEFIQIFVISNGTDTKYYSNTTRGAHINEYSEKKSNSKRASESFEFTSFWADANNKNIHDLVDFTKTFFVKHTILNILLRYCVFTEEKKLLVMRPYQIAAAERILNKIEISNNYKKYKTGGFIWHTTGSGKTLTSFKTAQLAAHLPYIDKVLFVVDRKDLDYQTQREYDNYQKGATNGTQDVKYLKMHLENPQSKIIVTTIQKLDNFVNQNKNHEVYQKHVVLIFDECHRSQFGEMHKAITRAFKKYHIFGFTGTPIFSQNAGNKLKTTSQIFRDESKGEEDNKTLHTYTIINAINDGNVLPFRIDYVNTFKTKEGGIDKEVADIDRKKALSDPQRIANVVKYILTHFNQKTKRGDAYSLKEREVKGFNSLFAVESIPAAIAYYKEFKKQIAESDDAYKLRIAAIYSASLENNGESDLLPDETFETDSLDKPSREFLNEAIADFNSYFKTEYDNKNSENFYNYYKELSKKIKNKEIDLVIVVNMLLTGFDAKTLNTLWVDKNLRMHGLLQAFSRTNRILNSVKSFGNIICFRDLKEKTDEAIALFGDKDAGSIVLLRRFEDYYYGYEDNKGEHHKGYVEIANELLSKFPIKEEIIGKKRIKEFIMLFGSLLKIINILNSFDEFIDDLILIDERTMQDYQGKYVDFGKKFKQDNPEKEDIVEDIVFEMELIRQIEVDIDYILMLIEKYHEGNCKDKTICDNISRAVDSTIQLRSKKALIMEFVKKVNLETDIKNDWVSYCEEEKEKELESIIKEENLNPIKTREFINNAFRDNNFKDSGADIDALMPPISRFGKKRDEVKRKIIARLLEFYEKYSGIV